MTVEIICSIWDDDEYIVSLRPKDAPPWTDLPVGCTVTKSEGELIVRWLNSCLPELVKVAQVAMQHVKEELGTDQEEVAG